MKNLLLAAPESMARTAGRGELIEAQVLLKQTVLDSVTSPNTRGHSSIQTTERYLGSEQEIAIAVNENIGL